MRKRPINWINRIVVSLVIIGPGVLIATSLINAAYREPWTGFNEALTKQHFSDLKTLWDWLQLLIVPLAIAGVGLWFNRTEHYNDRVIATEDRHERILQSYLDKMSELLLDKDNNLIAMPQGHIVRDLARARTLTVLQGLGGDLERKTRVIQFLFEAGLIGGGNEIIGLRNADLSRLPLMGAKLKNISLLSADLNQADLRLANLSGAKLGMANLSNTNLRGADLTGADLTEAYLAGADLTGADLTGACLSGANVLKARFYRCPGITLDMIWETKYWQDAWFNEDFWRQLTGRLARQVKAPISAPKIVQPQQDNGSDQQPQPSNISNDPTISSGTMPK